MSNLHVIIDDNNALAKAEEEWKKTKSLIQTIKKYLEKTDELWCDCQNDSCTNQISFHTEGGYYLRMYIDNRWKSQKVHVCSEECFIAFRDSINPVE